MNIQKSSKPYMQWWQLSLMFFLLGTTGVQADIYFWEDDKGVLYFTNINAPPQAELYAREVAEAAPVSDMPNNNDANDDQVDSTRYAALQDRLKASQEKVDQLTREVRDAKEAARDAAITARQVQAQLDDTVQEQAASEPIVEERIVYYAVPRRWKKEKHKKDYYFHHKSKPVRKSSVHRKSKFQRHHQPVPKHHQRLKAKDRYKHKYNQPIRESKDNYHFHHKSKPVRESSVHRKSKFQRHHQSVPKHHPRFKAKERYKHKYNHSVRRSSVHRRAPF